MIDCVIEHLNIFVKSFYDYGIRNGLTFYISYYVNFINFSCKPEFNLSIENKEIILNFIIFILKEFKQYKQNISINAIRNIYISFSNLDEFKEVTDEFKIIFLEAFDIFFDLKQYSNTLSN